MFLCANAIRRRPLAISKLPQRADKFLAHVIGFLFIQLDPQRHLRGLAAYPVLSLPLIERPVVGESRRARGARRIAALLVVWVERDLVSHDHTVPSQPS